MREGDFKTLLSRDLSVLILADAVVSDGEERDAITNWVKKGGLLVRFAGPELADHPDALLPVKLLEGDRQLGGTMSWRSPNLGEFAGDSPFGGLTVPKDVRISRQVLAEPDAHLSEETWARLSDGTPLVTQTALARGGSSCSMSPRTPTGRTFRCPACSSTCCGVSSAAVGVGADDDPNGPPLAPAELLNGFGHSHRRPPPWRQSPPPSLPRPSPVRAIRRASMDPRTVGARSTSPRGSTCRRPRRRSAGANGADQRNRHATALGPWMLAAALALLAVDLLLSLGLRGLYRPRTAGGVAAAVALVLLMTPLPSIAQQADASGPNPALQTRLAYFVTGDAQADGISRAGLAGLSDYVNRRTAASLAEPAAANPGDDDLSLYPLIYWPIIAGADAPSNAAVAALNTFMANGGIIVIDTRNGGSGEDFAPGADEALQQFTKGLTIPPLTGLTTAHVLARAFYLLQDFPGRYDGDTVWVQRDQDRTNDSVSPVIIGGNDWAAAWAVDGQGRNPYAVIPGGARQRTLAYRFGVNLVMYALTGNYKGDQVHVPALLERLGQ